MSARQFLLVPEEGTPMWMVGEVVDAQRVNETTVVLTIQEHNTPDPFGSPIKGMK